MRVLIVDDEAPARAKLRRMLAASADVDVVGEAAGGAEAITLATTLAPDVLFVDVQMPEVDGFDVAASVPDDGPALVFVTAYDRYALQAFDARATDYLLKPVEPERLARTLERLRRRAGAAPRERGAPPECLLIPDRGRTHVVRRAEIDWLEAADNYVTVHAGKRALLMRRTLAGLLDDLGPDFVRCHRSAAVPLRRIASVCPRDKGDATLVLDNGAEVACSRQYRADVVRRLGA